MVEFEHEQVEQVVGHQSHRLVAVGRLEQGEDRRGVLGVMQYVDGSRWSCKNNKTTNDYYYPFIARIDAMLQLMMEQEDDGS